MLHGEEFVKLSALSGEILLKPGRPLDRAHQAQCINYLRATGKHLCLLLNPARLTWSFNALFRTCEPRTAIATAPHYSRSFAAICVTIFLDLARSNRAAEGRKN